MHFTDVLSVRDLEPFAEFRTVRVPAHEPLCQSLKLRGGNHDEQA